MSISHENNTKIKNILAKNPNAVFVHVTDTYFIEDSSVNDIIDLPGFARINSMINMIREDPLVKKNKIPIFVLHGGDFLYPSLMSLYFEGKQMIDVMNLCKFNYCTLGNHDFDGGLESLSSRMSEASFKTICVNIKNPKEKMIFKIFDYVTCCIGFDDKPLVAIIGVAWKATMRKAQQKGFVTESIESSLEKIIIKIKKEHPKIKHLIVLSHMGNQEDENLKGWLERKWDDGYVFLLGGHDHNRMIAYNDKIPQSILLKGQSNCRTIQIVGVPRNQDQKNIQYLREHTTMLNSLEISKFHPETKIVKRVTKWESELEEFLEEEKTDRVVKRFAEKTILDAREMELRKGSTNFGNFIADCVLDFADTDIAFINSGHFRGDRKIGNQLKISDLRRIFVLDKKICS